MPEDRDRTRRDARDRIRTPPRGVPVEIDPELTPPPQMPPIQGSDHDKIEALEAGLDQAFHAIGKTWDARKDGDRLDKIDHRLETSSRETAELGALLREFVMPGLKSSMARIDLLLTHHEGNKVRQELFYDKDWPTFVKAFESIGDRLSRLERTVHDSQNDMRGLSERFSLGHGALSNRIAAGEEMCQSHGVRITALERVNEDAKTVDVALAKQERRKSRGQSALVAAAIAVLSWVAQHFTK